MRRTRSFKAQSAPDGIYLVIALFLTIIGLFAADVIWSALTSNPAFQSVANATSQGQTGVQQAGTAINIINNGMVFIFIFAAIASAIAAAFTTSSPVFAIPGLIVLPIELLLVFIFHDAFFVIIQNSWFAPIAAVQVLGVTLMAYLPIVALISWVVMLVVTFIK